MFNKPKDFDAVQGYGEFKPLALGGHHMVICSVEVTVSKTNKPMLKISLDTDGNDEQPGYFAARWREDTRQDKRWGCIYYQLTEDSDGNTSRGFKTFITSVEESNPGFTIQWGEQFESCLKGKKVGGVFGREEYLDNQGQKKMATKLFSFRSIQAINEGVEIPADKLLQPENKSASFPNIPQSSYGQQVAFNPYQSTYQSMHTPQFAQVDTQDDLPF